MRLMAKRGVILAVGLSALWVVLADPVGNVKIPSDIPTEVVRAKASWEEKMRTENWQSNTRGLRLVGEGESGSASTTFGPVRAGLITTPRTQEAQLSELLSCLEREVEILESKYSEVLDTLTDVTEHLVRLTGLLLPTSTTKEVK